MGVTDKQRITTALASFVYNALLQKKYVKKILQVKSKI